MPPKDCGALQLMPPRGTTDYPPNEFSVFSSVTRALGGVLERGGYSAIRTPMFERFGLLAMRAGDAIRHSMFTFTSERIEYALRPEMTTPIGRMVASGMLQGPAPRRVRYEAPCFRYERPGSLRPREFTQVGAELFDIPAPWGDVEAIALAAECARAVDGGRICVRVGDIRILGSQLTHLSPAGRAKAASLLNDALTVESRCTGLADLREVDDGLKTWLRDLAASVYRLQQGVGLGDAALRPPEVYTPDTVASLADALPRASRDATRRALVKFAGLEDEQAGRLIDGVQVRGSIGDVVEIGRGLFGDAAAPGLTCLEEVCCLAELAGATQIEASLGVARGLEFYTGTVLALVVPGVPGSPTIGGGGRYDHLIEELGGADTPAVGFAVEVEQVLATLGRAVPAVARRVVEVTPLDESARGRAVSLSSALRAAGICAPLPHPTHSASGADARVAVPAAGPIEVTVGGRVERVADPETLITLLRSTLREGDCL